MESSFFNSKHTPSWHMSRLWLNINMKHLDLTYLNWAKAKASSGSAGSFLKSYYRNTYYKLSNYDQIKGIVGHESVNEYVVSRLLVKIIITYFHIYMKSCHKSGLIVCLI